MPEDRDTLAVWGGSFGRDYTERNLATAEDEDRHTAERLGITRSAMNCSFLDAIPRSTTLFEVGTNVGVQLSLLGRMGFSNLLGLEYQRYALERGRTLGNRTPAVQGSAFELPVRDAAVDLVFTSGVLIHIPPDKLDAVIDEMVRISRRWVWGYEYWNNELVELPYRGVAGALWKGNYAARFLERHPGLKLVKEVRYPYREGDLSDTMYLLEKPR